MSRPAGSHGTAFGGKPLAMAVGNAVLDVMLAPGFFDRVKQNALLLRQRLAEIQDHCPHLIAEVRGDGAELTPTEWGILVALATFGAFGAMTVAALTAWLPVVLATRPATTEESSS